MRTPLGLNVFTSLMKAAASRTAAAWAHSITSRKRRANGSLRATAPQNANPRSQPWMLRLRPQRSRTQERRRQRRPQRQLPRQAPTQNSAAGKRRITNKKGIGRLLKKVGLARAISKLGHCSRSCAAELIAAGRVRWNGTVRRDPETPVHLGKDRIEIDAQPPSRASKVYLSLNK